MYYSLLMLNRRSRQVQREIAAPYEMHRTLMAAFPVGAVGVQRTDGAAGVLFRLDVTRDGQPIVLVQSQTRPDWSVLKPDYLAAPPQVKEREPSFARGQVLAFRLRANPTRRLSAGSGNKGKRVGIYREEEQLGWLARKGEQHGFRIVQAQVSHKTMIVEREAVAQGETRHDLKLLSVQFDGILQVTDPVLLQQAITAGIGSGKGFGFGLLSLAPWRG